MARGESAYVDWHIISRTPQVVTYLHNDTPYTIDLTNVPLGTIIQLDDMYTGFYVMYSQTEFDTGNPGQNDPNDIYHFFVAATAAYYGSTGQNVTDSVYRGIPDADRMIAAIMEEMEADSGDATEGYHGWSFANALSYAEGALFGISSEDIHRESDVHRRGALFGLEQAGITPDAQWQWYVPSQLGGPDIGGYLKNGWRGIW